MIKYILWDIDGTLLNFELAEDKSIRQSFEYFNLGSCSDELLEDYKKINIKYWQALERGEIGKQEVLEGRFKEFFNKYGINDKITTKFNEYYQKALASTGEFNPHAYEVVDYFKGKYKQFAATNGTKIAQDGKLKKSGLDKILEKVFISEEVGFEKPSLGFFDYVFKYTQDFDKDSYVIIGDSLTSDIRGGINAGIKTIWFNPKKIEKNIEIRCDYIISSLDELKNIL